jgi:hypothetical protein
MPPRARLAPVPDRGLSVSIARECAYALASAGLMDVKTYVDRYASVEETHAGVADSIVPARAPARRREWRAGAR